MDTLTFIASKLFWGLAQPGNFLLVLLLVGLLLAGTRRRRRTGIRLAWAGASGLLLFATLPIGDLLIAPLEARFPPTSLEAPLDGIIVLGGATPLATASLTGDGALNDAAERMTEGARLANRFPDARLLFTGGSGEFGAYGLTEADVAARVWAGLLSPGRAVLYERESRNTWENARNAMALARPRPGERWALVTSAFHMPRAVGIFRRVGWDIIPVPVDYRSEAGAIGLRFDLQIGLELSEVALKEWIGLIAYRLLDRTTELLPGPATPVSAAGDSSAPPPSSLSAPSPPATP